jgi:predicted dienelactone hydrolase
MEIIKNYSLKLDATKPITLDIYWQASTHKKPIVVFAHGFKGFKDWGHWHLIAERFAQEGFCFIKFNFSHNGVGTKDFTSFTDLEAFGQNNFEKEMTDLQQLLDWIQTSPKVARQCLWDSQNITLIGHSRGGPIAILEGLQREAVGQIITWAGVHELNYAWEHNPDLLADWEKQGLRYILNGRTKQNMPLYYQMYENYQINQAYFSVKNALKKHQKPFLIIHGSEDPAVPVTAAKYLFQHASDAQIFIVEGANHVFGGKHPYGHTYLPEHSLQIVDKSMRFIRQHIT